MGTAMVTCTRCKTPRPSSEFYRDNRKANGLQSRCKQCVRALQRADRPARREWERRHLQKPGVRERLAAQKRLRRERDPETHRAQARARYAMDSARHMERNRGYSIRRRFGLTTSEYETLLASQGGVCAICGGNRSVKPTFRLSIDHDHGDGRVRGLLCSSCNIGLGFYSDDPTLLRSAAAYLERTQTTTTEAA